MSNNSDPKFTKFLAILCAMIMIWAIASLIDIWVVNASNPTAVHIHAIWNLFDILSILFS